MTIGQASQTGTITIGNSTAGNEIDIGIGVNTGAQLITIGNGASGANTEVDILSGVGTAGVGTLKMGNNTRITTINLGNVAPAAARTTTIAGGNSAQNDTVTILGGAPTANTQTFNVLSGNNAGGTQVLNLATGTGGKTVHLADGGGVNTVTIGSSNTSSTTTIQAGTGSLSLLSGQVVSINSSVNSGASPYTVVGTDFFIGCDPTAGPITVTLPVAPATGRHVIVVDATGQAAANNITISGNGKNISSGGTSAASKVLSTAYSSLNIYYNGTIWNAA